MLMTQIRSVSFNFWTESINSILISVDVIKNLLILIGITFSPLSIPFPMRFQNNFRTKIIRTVSTIGSVDDTHWVASIQFKSPQV